MLVAHRRLPGLVAVVGALGALGLPAQSLAAPDLGVSGQGRVVATIADATAAEQPEVVCENLDMEQVATCPASYAPGQLVTLRAEPVGSSSFGFWSDDRCPAGPVCTLAADRDDQTVVASFSPQRLTVFVSNNTRTPATLTSTPAGLTCENDTSGEPGVTMDGGRQYCVGDFALSTEMTLRARGGDPAWGPGVFGDACDAIDGAACSLAVHSNRRVALTFGPPFDWPVGQPGDVGVVFRVARGGTGSGTVRSESLDCGDDCDAPLNFGDRQTLVAAAARGSRFVRWRGACGTSPRCSLAVGPVTRVTAVFDAVGTPPETTPSATAPQQSRRGSSAPPAYAARVGRIVVRGTRPRRIHFTVGVSARSSIRAVLGAGGRPVSSRTWTVRRGERVLRLRVPTRARPGAYVLRITARDGAGNVSRFTRRVRLRR